MSDEGRKEHQRDKAKITPGVDRFVIGFMAAMVVPLVKIYQQGLPIDEDFNGWVLVGLAIPFLAMGIFVGLYAVFIEKNEYNYGRLFRMCLAVPAMLTSIVGGVDPEKGMIETAEAASPKVESTEIKCTESKGIKKGLDHAFQALTNKKVYQFFIVSEEEKTNRFVKIGDTRYYIQGMTNIEGSGPLMFDRYKCRLIQTIKLDSSKKTEDKKDVQ